METFKDMIKDFDIKFLEELRDKFIPMDRENIPGNAEVEAIMRKENIADIITKKTKVCDMMEEEVNNLLKKKYEIRTTEEASKGAKGTGVPSLIKSNGKWRVAK